MGPESLASPRAAAAAIGASATTDCSVAQIVEQSKDLLLTMALAAASDVGAAVDVDRHVAGPHAEAGLPVLCAARTIGVPPVARIIEVA